MRQKFKTATLIVFITILLLNTFLHFLQYFILPIDASSNSYYQVTWKWGNPYGFTDLSIQDDIDFAYSKGIKRIALDLNQYPQMANITVSYNDPSIIQQYEERIRYFISYANSKGIKVDGLVANNSTVGETRINVFKILDFIKSFNSKYVQNIDGIHLDLEFYNTKEYWRNQKNTAIRFLDLTEDIRDYAKEYNSTKSEFIISFDISAFMDDRSSAFPNVNYNKSVKPIAFHLINLLGEYLNSEIVIMAYRNFADGEGSTSSLVIDELDYAKSVNSTVKIIIAQETSNSDLTTNVSFYGLGINYLNSQLELLFGKFGIYPQFHGFAIHNLDSYKDLK